MRQPGRGRRCRPRSLGASPRDRGYPSLLPFVPDCENWRSRRDLVDQALLSAPVGDHTRAPSAAPVTAATARGRVGCRRVRSRRAPRSGPHSTSRCRQHDFGIGLAVQFGERLRDAVGVERVHVVGSHAKIPARAARSRRGKLHHHDRPAATICFHPPEADYRYRAGSQADSRPVGCYSRTIAPSRSAKVSAACVANGRSSSERPSRRSTFCRR